MRKLVRFAALGAIAFGTITVTPTETEAGDRHGAAVAAGIVGLAAGAIIAGSAANAYGYPATYGYGYAEPVHYVYKPRRLVRVIVERPYYGHGYDHRWGSPVHPHWRKKARWYHHGHYEHRDRPRCWLPERHLCY